MKQLKKFEFPVSTFGQGTHKWDDILAAVVPAEQLGKPGPVVQLIHGEDFTGDPQNFGMMIRNQAAKRHLKAKVSKVEKDDVISLYVQTCKMTDEEAAAADARFEEQKEKGKARREAKKASADEATIPMQETA